jgi:guanylate kinase
MSQEGKLVVISGPSGVGKSTVCEELLKLPGFERVVTCTTRAARAGEIPGQHYHFLTRDEFAEGIQKDKYLEYACVHGQLYGTPREAVQNGIRRGSHVLLSIDIQGARQVRERCRDAKLTTIFLAPPDFDELERRLRQRGTDGAAEIAARIETAKKEMMETAVYDHVVVNRRIDDTVREVLSAIGYGREGSPPTGARSRKEAHGN